MLTSYHTLFGGFAAVSCALGMVSQKDLGGFLYAPPESSQNLPLEISYRGSGRLDEHPEGGDHTQQEASLISHRGSGRIQPQCLL